MPFNDFHSLVVSYIQGLPNSQTWHQPWLCGNLGAMAKVV